MTRTRLDHGRRLCCLTVIALVAGANDKRTDEKRERERKICSQSHERTGSNDCVGSRWNIPIHCKVSWLAGSNSRLRSCGRIHTAQHRIVKHAVGDWGETRQDEVARVLNGSVGFSVALSVFACLSVNLHGNHETTR